MTKTCKRCLEDKDTSYFYKANKSKDGLQSYCKTCQNTLNKQWAASHCDIIREIDKKSYNKHRRKRIEKSQKWNLCNASKYRQNKVLSNRRAYSTPLGKLSVCLRNRLNCAIRRGTKGGSAVKMLGCTITELKVYLEARFQPGMSWGNWTGTGWHIDHIKPLSSFDLSSPQEVSKACHYTNLQPLWYKENLSKGAKRA